MQTQTSGHTGKTRSKSAKLHKAPSRKAKVHKPVAAKQAAPNISESLDNLLDWSSHPQMSTLSEIHLHYSKDVFFKDPLVEVYSADELETYYGRIYEKMTDMHFVINNKCREGHQAFVTWVMTAKMLGQDFSVRGTSHFKFDPSTGLCEYHRDYFDMAEEIYEQIPILGFVFKSLRKSLN